MNRSISSISNFFSLVTKNDLLFVASLQPKNRPISICSFPRHVQFMAGKAGVITGMRCCLGGSHTTSPSLTMIILPNDLPIFQGVAQLATISQRALDSLGWRFGYQEKHANPNKEVYIIESHSNLAEIIYRTLTYFKASTIVSCHFGFVWK